MHFFCYNAKRACDKRYRTSDNRLNLTPPFEACCGSLKHSLCGVITQFPSPLGIFTTITIVMISTAHSNHDNYDGTDESRWKQRKGSNLCSHSLSHFTTRVRLYGRCTPRHSIQKTIGSANTELTFRLLLISIWPAFTSLSTVCYLHSRSCGQIVDDNSGVNEFLCKTEHGTLQKGVEMRELWDRKHASWQSDGTIHSKDDTSKKRLDQDKKYDDIHFLFTFNLNVILSLCKVGWQSVGLALPLLIFISSSRRVVESQVITYGGVNNFIKYFIRATVARCWPSFRVRIKWRAN